MKRLLGFAFAGFISILFYSSAFASSDCWKEARALALAAGGQKISERDVPHFQPSAEASKTVYFLLGAPAAGKGTIGRPLAQKLGIEIVGMGDVLRAIRDSGSPLGQKIKALMDSGKLIGSEDLIPVLKELVESKNPKIGLMTDGAPRRLSEAQALEKMVLDRGWTEIRALLFDLPLASVVERARGRLICSNKSCAYSYHDTFRPPLVANHCDECSSALIRRVDDTDADVIQTRIETFEEETQPVIDYFAAKKILYRLDANLPVAEVWKQVLKVLP